MSPEFLATALVVVLAPGTGVIYTLAVALARGRLASIWAAFGCTLGIVPHMVAAILGVAAILHASALLFQVVKFAGVAYLLWLAWQTIRDRGALKVEAGKEAGSLPRIAVTGTLINILNPKLSIFFLAFLPQFVDPAAASPLGAMVELSAVFMAMTFVVFAAYGFVASAVRDRMLASARVMAWMRRGFAAAFVALGAKLALTTAR
ncbi:LysE family translocator [Oricola indica]|jgi:threonine/homoserine/homoserine lactone efflux protein|uniref:LysE family translocator n=1 Tax=Oricola indica TaxID=2872591 RepID=UPI001CBC42E0|nr:LysE family translocator [Oricola indica]